MPTVADLGEHQLIQRITKRLASAPWVVVGPGDDAAVVRPRRGTFEVLTTDALVEGVHFDCRFVPPDAIGHRALAVNVSDLAAMGAEPRSALLSLALPATLEIAALDGIMDGLVRVADAHRVIVIGGNVTRSPGPLMLNLTVTGTVRPRRALTRAGARPGDEVFVTGSLGDAAVGLRSLQQSCEPAASREASYICCEERYLRPDARVRAGLLLARNRAASSCIDLSDGLADGVRQLAAASRVGITLDAGAIPITDEVRGWHERHGGNALQTAVAGGDDYELLFTVRRSQLGRLRGATRRLSNLPITRIGIVTGGSDLLLSDEMGKHELPVGFEHFR
jgi:thiamine-monophosphate kinase